jgi:hypothetical protein
MATTAGFCYKYRTLFYGFFTARGVNMTHRRLIAAGWLAMVSAALTVPWVIATFFLADKTGAAAKAVEASLLVCGTVLFVYLLATLRRLLHERYDFRAADGAIALLIKANIVSAAVALLGLAIPSMEESIGVFGIIIVVIVGILQLSFGIKLLQLPSTLKGLHKPYCYLNMVTGVCTAMIVLLPVGVLTSAVADVMLGTIFFHAATEPKTDPSAD